MGDFLLRAGRAWDPVRGLLEGGVEVRVSAGSIVAVDGRARGTDASEANPGDVRVLDFGAEATILPGLVDCHTHLCFDPAGDPVAQFTGTNVDPTELEQRAVAAAGRALQAGITTVRDLGDYDYVTLQLRRRQAADGAGQAALPELVLAGPPITPTRGHCWFLGGEADGVDGIERAVAEHADRGVDVVKVMVTGGMLTPGFGMHQTQYGDSELSTLVDAARHVDLPVAAHAHGGDGIAAALHAGVEGIEHATFVTAEGVDYDAATVDRLAAARTIVSVTEAWLPSDIPLPPAAANRLETVWRNIVRMHQAGVRLAISSDAGVGPRKPHDVLPYGAVLLGDLGIPVHDVLGMMTTVPAHACRLGHRKGCLAPGFDADILITDGNPTHDLTALLRPLGVIRNGHAARYPTAKGAMPRTSVDG